MEIKFEIVPAPMVTEFEVTGSNDERDFARELKETGILYVDARKETKTSVSTSIKVGKHMFSINTRPQKTKHKFLEKTIRNIWTYGTKLCFFFRIQKTQGLDEYKEHLSDTLQHLLSHLGVRQLTVRLYNTHAIKELQAVTEEMEHAEASKVSAY